MAVPNTAVTKNLALANDGWRRTAYPNGATPNSGPTAAPEFTTSKTSSRITAAITNGYGATAFEVSVNGEDWVAGLTISGLAESTPYTFRVRGSNQHGIGPMGVANVTTDAAAAGAASFEDDFASGDLSKTMNGYSWGVPAGDVSVVNNQVEMTFGPNASGSGADAELNFDFDAPRSEVWVEYDITIPANWAIRANGQNYNNKFFQLNYNGGYYTALTIEFAHPNPADGTAMLRRFLAASETAGGAQNWPTAPTPIQNFIGPGCTMVPGNTYQIRVHFRSSPDGVADGIAELYIGGVLIRSLSWPFWKVATSGQINGGYVLGWANTGYTDETKFLIDNFKIYASDPGWT